MKTRKRAWLMLLGAVAVCAVPVGPARAEDTPSLKDAFLQGKFSGALKSYYFSEAYDGQGLSDASIWVNGGLLSYTTARFHGFDLGATFQASVVSARDDDDNRMRGSMDADGAVLSEAFLGYGISNTGLKLGRQFLSSPMVSSSGSRLIKESFEAYMLTNKDIPGTALTVGWVTKYQTRTDQSRYGDNWFVDYDMNGDGNVGDFYDIGDDGLLDLYAKNTSIDNLTIQAQYVNVFDEVAAFYADAMYTFDMDVKPYFAGQFYYTDYSDSTMDSNSLWGIKAGVKISDFDLFAAYTTAGGDPGDARVFRGVGQGSYAIYTTTIKSSGVLAYEAGTDAFQGGVRYKIANLSARFRYSVFDDPAPGKDLDEYTFDFLYKFGGLAEWAEGFSLSIDFSILDYENDQKDQTDLRTRLIYSF